MWAQWKLRITVKSMTFSSSSFSLSNYFTSQNFSVIHIQTTHYSRVFQQQQPKSKHRIQISHSHCSVHSIFNICWWFIFFFFLADLGYSVTQIDETFQFLSEKILCVKFTKWKTNKDTTNNKQRQMWINI